MNVMALLHDPVFPKPGSRVIAPALARKVAISKPTSPSVPTTVGNSKSLPSSVSRAVFAITNLLATDGLAPVATCAKRLPNARRLSQHLSKLQWHTDRHKYRLRNGRYSFPYGLPILPRPQWSA